MPSACHQQDPHSMATLKSRRHYLLHFVDSFIALLMELLTRCSEEGSVGPDVINSLGHETVVHLIAELSGFLGQFI